MTYDTEWKRQPPSGPIERISTCPFGLTCAGLGVLSAGTTLEGEKLCSAIRALGTSSSSSNCNTGLFHVDSFACLRNLWEVYQRATDLQKSGKNYAVIFWKGFGWVPKSYLEYVVSTGKASCLTYLEVWWSSTIFFNGCPEGCYILRAVYVVQYSLSFGTPES